MNLTPKMVATRYHISVPTVYRWVRQHHLPAVRLGKRVLRFSEIDLVEWEKLKFPHDQSQSSQADESGGPGVLPGARPDTGPGESGQEAQDLRDQRAKSVFALDEPTPNPVRQSEV
jgi:excisionase family DNA binding protein